MSRFCRYKLLRPECLLVLLVVPVFAAAQVVWVQDLDTALKKATKEGKLVVLDMSASW